MHNNELDHAQKVVDNFKTTLPDSVLKHLGKKHFDDLVLLINSAIESSVLEVMEDDLEEMERLVKKLKAKLRK
jgi:bifunctional DNA-binding transcriptional regulator/antitoxin component of YhaV-PrlF toxin-antitoxin module